MSFANRTAQAVLNSIFGKASVFGALASAPPIYVALSTAAIGEDGSGIAEPVGNGYARVATVAADWNDATLADPSLLDNAAAITFPEATGAWGTITHFALFDAVTGGNYLASGALTLAKSPTDGDTPAFAAGTLDVTLD